MRKLTFLFVLLIYVNKYISVEGCTAAKFECVNGECIPADERCDNEFDCTDMSDELNCTVQIFCPEGQYRCDNDLCVDSNARCNGFVECEDGSDEINCPGTYTAPVTLTLSGVSSMSNLSDVSNQPSYLLYTSLDQRITTVYVEPTVLFSSKSSYTSEFSNFSSSKGRHTLSTTNLLSSVSNTLILVSTIFQDVTTTSSQESSMDIYSVESKTLTTYSKIHHSNVVTQSIYSYATRSKPDTSSIYSKGVLMYDRTEIDCTLLAVLISILIVAVVITVIVALAWRHKMRERARMDTHGSILSRNMVRPDPHILYPENIDTVYRTVFRQPRCEREWTRMGTRGSLSSRNLAHTDPYIRYPENKDTVYRTVFRQSRHGFLWY